MKRLDKVNRKRFKAMIFACLFLGLISLGSLGAMYMKPELELSAIVITGMTGVITLATAFIAGDTYRKSNAIEPEV